MVSQHFIRDPVEDLRGLHAITSLYVMRLPIAARLAQAVDAADIPNLWKPGRESSFRIAALPVLGTGKLDLRAMKELARQLTTKTP